jgi:baseplate J-like protein
VTLITAPRVDPRTPAEVAEQTRALLCKYLAHAPYNWSPEADGGEAGVALTKIFAHYCGLIVDRLNRAPEKNFLAFLDLLGNSLIPAQPARAAVTFALDTSAGRGTLLPAGTKIQAEPPPGIKDPIFFETENDVWLTTVDLVGVRGINGDTIVDLDRLIGSPNATSEPVFEDRSAYDFFFSLGPDRPLPARVPVEMYLWLDSATYDPTTWGSTSEPVALSWQCSPSSGGPWTRLLVEDETDALTRSGVVRFLTPSTEGWGTATVKSFRVRANAPLAPYAPPALLRCVALNTVSAIQAITVSNEILGSSNGSAGQVFRTLKQPVLPGQELSVLEQRVSTNAGTGTPSADPWIPWHEVADFHASEALDRQYVLNRQTGQVRFGDGQRGMIPPRGARSIRTTRYRAGGGIMGNVPAGALKTLVSGSKQIATVTNLFAATAGADAEEQPALLDRAPRTLRHRQRAVTQEDYEDLSKLASTEVARALCVPLQDLAAEPYKFIDTLAEEKVGVGKVSVIVVPRSDEAKPLPSPDLMRRVQAYLAERASAEAAVTVVGPLYLRVSIHAEIRLQSLRWKDAVEGELQASFAAFLHPLTGNAGGGWPFGRQPHESDIYPLIARVKGIAYVAGLGITALADHPERTVDTLTTQRFLVCSGEHQVDFL